MYIYCPVLVSGKNRPDHRRLKFGPSIILKYLDKKDNRSGLGMKLQAPVASRIPQRDVKSCLKRRWGGGGGEGAKEPCSAW